MAAPKVQLVEHWAPGSDSPGSRRFAARYMILPAGIGRGRWQRPRSVEVGERGGPCQSRVLVKSNPLVFSAKLYDA